ncbi:MAG: hypothetical protein AABX71_00130 [Nanoarchaeota archaeon]
MQTELLNEVVGEIAGKQASGILEILMGKRDVNEFLIAKKLGLTINQVRNILYKLSNFNLVTFSRKKDKKKGWYTYFWTLDTEKVLELLEKRFAKEIETLINQLKSRKVKRFYVCRICKSEFSEETALLHNFVCSECGEVYDLADHKKIMRELERNIVKIEKQKAGVSEELRKIKEEREKKRVKKEKRKVKEKIREKAVKKEKKKLEKKKQEKEKKKPMKKIIEKKKKLIKSIKKIIGKAIKKKKSAGKKRR